MWYHQYVYDHESRKLIGQFEDLYREGATNGLDAWHQDALDVREDVALAQCAVAEVRVDRPLRTVVDLGCGKGVLARHLFADVERYLGIDVSETAVATARSSFPTMEFVQSNVQTGEDLSRVVSHRCATDLDLFFCCQTLSFMDDWSGILEQATRSFKAVVVVLYLPPNPIGHIKSFGSLVDEVGRNFSEISCRFSPSGSHLAISGRCVRPSDDAVDESHDRHVALIA